MSSFIEIELPMPFVRLNVTGFLAKIRKPSGMQYLLLRMLKFGSEANGKYTISDLMKLFGFPEDMSEMILAEIVKLQNLNMIETINNRKVTPKMFLKTLSLTSAGEDIFNKGHVSVEAKPIDIFIIYMPGLVRIYYPDSNPDIIPGKKYDFKKPELKRLESYLRSDPKRYGVEEDDTIYDLDYKAEREHSYLQKVLMEFDEQIGAFIFTSRSETNTDFIKMNYSGEEIIKAIPDEPFILRSNLGFEVKRWGDAPSGIQYISRLPCDFEPYLGLLVNSPVITKISDKIPSFSVQADLESDMVYFESQKVAYKVWFSRNEASVSGFDGSKNVKLVLQHRMSDQELEHFKDFIASKIRYMWNEDIEFLDKLAVFCIDSTVFTRVVEAQLNSPDSENLKKVISHITRFDSSFWWRDLALVLETILCRWTDSLDIDQINDCIESLVRRNISIKGDSLVPVMLSRYDSVKALDIALKNSMSITWILKDIDMTNSLIQKAMEYTDYRFESVEISSINLMMANLNRLKSVSGIDNLKIYRIGKPPSDKEIIKDLSSSLNALSDGIEKIINTFGPHPKIISMLESYRVVFDCYVGALKSKKQHRTRADYVNETNPYLFFLKLMDKLKFELLRLNNSNIDESSMISVVTSMESIPENSRIHILEFIHASNAGLHTDIVKEISAENRRAWASAVFQLSNLE